MMDARTSRAIWIHILRLAAGVKRAEPSGFSYSKNGLCFKSESSILSGMNHGWIETDDMEYGVGKKKTYMYIKQRYQQIAHAQSKSHRHGPASKWG